MNTFAELEKKRSCFVSNCYPRILSEYADNV